MHALNAAGASVGFVEIESDKGHDAFLLDEPEMFAAVRGFLDAAARRGGSMSRPAPAPPSRLRGTADVTAIGRRGRFTLRVGGPSARRRRPERGAARLDLLLVADMVEPGSRVLDVGCGDGALLALLRDRRERRRPRHRALARGRQPCLAKGLPVIQGDADTDLADYPDDAFDYVILSQTIQATRQPRAVLEHLLRIGRRAIVSFPNFGHWRIRSTSLLRGRMPMTENLPLHWYDTPNIHFCTIRDFVGAVPRGRRQDGEGGRAQRRRPAGARHHALVGLEPVRRAGGVPAPPPVSALDRL